MGVTRAVVLGYALVIGTVYTVVGVTMLISMAVQDRRARRRAAGPGDAQPVDQLDDVLDAAPAEVLSDFEVNRRCERIAAANFIPTVFPLPDALKEVVL